MGMMWRIRNPLQRHRKEKKANIQRTFERMKDMGIAGYLRFLAKKMLTVYNDGTYAWGGEGNFLWLFFHDLIII